MNSNEKTEKGLFVGHGTYAPRESWLFKGMEAVAEAEQTTRKRNPFLRLDAAERFGIGSSMVASACFWVKVTGLVEERIVGTQRVASLTPFGKLVWIYDRYLEQLATLCWMHYHVICNKTLAPTWYWFYNHGPITFFSVQECLSTLWHWAVSRFAEQEIRPGALQRDMACLLRMYIPRSRATTPEDLTLSPFSRLHMIQRLKENQEIRYQRIPPNGLHPLILLALLTDQQSRAGSSQVPLLDALYQPMSVGRCFNLSATLLLELLAQIPNWHHSWQVQVMHAADRSDLLTLPPATFLEVVQSYYRQKIDLAG